ncbi:response regulator transcription factor [Solimicrobium silvestre]|uniref:Response regulators consisting of a CheY-like receiver domain and a winged-helix DNA-binding domain n=1 Tax=Solimicrobium silvestre TaxID=2099400 RepID=A0A2S9H2P2_9BURK|nr:response regulator transcription factor [Solimicrobium silvestre]PRC94230.1 Response regulators consisting of a CheY-like receiver domain and a winged-helix DNA-binding domain [Solimicrobium silvestre]
MRIAVLEDDTNLLELVCSILNSAGHSAHPFSSGKEMLHNLRRENYDMLILDWQVPDLSGTEVMHWVREKLSSTIPILFMTSRSGEDDIVAGLAAGADDYMIKPIRRSELVARVQALLRRAYPNQHMPEHLEFGRYIFETRSARLSLSGQFIDVTQKEFDLALLLFRNLGRPLSRAYILEAVWSRDIEIPSRTMDTHISRVRNKLQLRPENGFRLAPVYSYGYRLEQIPD